MYLAAGLLAGGCGPVATFRPPSATPGHQIGFAATYFNVEPNDAPFCTVEAKDAADMSLGRRDAMCGGAYEGELWYALNGRNVALFGMLAAED